MCSVFTIRPFLHNDVCYDKSSVERRDFQVPKKEGPLDITQGGAVVFEK